MNIRPLVLGAVLALTLGTVGAQAQTVPVPAWQRGEVGSAANLIYVRRRLETMIDQMQHDRHDYGGYRVQAIQALQQARQDIVAAIQYDASHGH